MKQRTTYHRNARGKRNEQDQQYKVLIHLRNNGKGTVKAIASAMDVNCSTARKWIELLRLEGLVRAETILELVVTLTDDGARFVIPEAAKPKPVDLQPCGHPVTASVTTFGGSRVCLTCRNEQREYVHQHGGMKWSAITKAQAR